MPIMITEPKKLYYYANYFSFSFLACLLMFILVIILTYLAVAYSGEVFIKNVQVVTQPNVVYYDYFILSLLFEDLTVKSYSSIIKFNDYYSDLLEVPLVKVNYIL